MPDQNAVPVQELGEDAVDAANELSDEGLELVVGGLARPWTDLDPIGQDWPPRTPGAVDADF